MAKTARSGGSKAAPSSSGVLIPAANPSPPSWIKREWLKGAPRSDPDMEAKAKRVRELLAEEQSSKPTLTKREKAKVYLKPSPVDFPPASQCTVEGELRRIAHGQRTNWHSPLRVELLRDGLIESCKDEETQLWTGDRITAAGLARLGT